MSKKRTKRSMTKYPNLDKTLNTKRRRDYTDHLYYIDGINDSEGKEVIRGLNEEEMQWMDQFTKEFYSASFDEDDSKNLHQMKVDTDTIKELRANLSQLRKDAAKEKDREVAIGLYAELRMAEDELSEVYPRKKCTDANNDRNRCLLNKGKATNKVKFIAWESLDQNTLGESDIELLYILNDMEKDED